MKLILAAVLLVVLTSCTPDPDRATRTILDAGYTDISLGDYSYFYSGCPEDMDINCSFAATQPANNRRVHGIVCCDLWATCMIRIR